MAKFKILIADDEELELNALEFQIKRFFPEFECIRAENGRTAAEKAFSFSPDIVLLDIQMPGLSGLEAAEKIRASSPKSIVVFLTAWNNFEFAQKAIRLGAFDYLVKPIDGESLKNLIQKCIEKIDSQSETISISSDSERLILSLEKAVFDIDEKECEETLRIFFEKNFSDKEMKDAFSVFSYEVSRKIPFLEIPDLDSKNDFQTLFRSFVKNALDAQIEDRRDKYSRIFSLVKKYIDENFANHLTVDDVSKEFGLHPAYFTRLFHDYTGSTFVEYLTKVRIDVAKKMLTDGELVKETARKCGFSDTDYFSKVFKKATGKRPIDFSSSNENA